MKIADFKKHKIIRSNPNAKNDYKDYKPDLKHDFCNRCAYCNLKDDTITTPFQVDHFIPQAVFKDKLPELMTDYNNLVYSCAKCNNAKSAQHLGNIFSDHPTNELFYDPVKTDYNKIFYRNEFGAIDSDDEKGREAIKRLKLYRPIHILAWLCEEMYITASKLQTAIKQETNDVKKEKLEVALKNLNNKYCKYSRIFIASYNDNYFSLSDL